LPSRLEDATLVIIQSKDSLHTTLSKTELEALSNTVFLVTGASGKVLEKLEKKCDFFFREV